MAVNQLKAGALLNYIILGLNALTGILYTPYMLRMLGQEEYGIYSLAASVIAYLSMLDFGFGNAIVRYTAKLRAKGQTEEQYAMFGMFTLLYTAIGVIAFVAGLILYFNINSIFGATMTAGEISRTQTIVLLMLFNLAFSFPLSIYGGIITAYENFVFLRVMQIARILLSTLAMVCLLSMGYKAVAMVVVSTIFNFITLAINVLYSRKHLGIIVRFGKIDWTFLKEVSVYSFWIFLNIIMDKVYWSTGQFVLGATIGPEAVAVFAIAVVLAGIYMSYSTAISGVFLPKITAMVTKDSNPHEISELFIRTGRIQAIIMNLILSGFIIFGYQFIILWAGVDYSESYICSLLFFIALYIPLIQNLGITILQARNQMRFRSTLYVCIAACSLALQILLSKQYGGLGCAVAVSGALIVGQGIIMNIYYHRKQQINIPKFWKEIAKISIAPIILTIGGALFLSKNVVSSNLYLLIGSIIVYVFVYFIFTWFIGLNRSEKELISAPIKRITSKFCR